MYNDKDWEMLQQIYQGVMIFWDILKNFLKEVEIVRYSNGWNLLAFKPQIKKINDWDKEKREASKEEAPLASTRKPQANLPKNGRIKGKKT
ncbi:hypothetical protein O181_037105 [Austropuccinia psidii MF-1]|uniref:Uncharacterized protein n=1 Tax=Austropuccinia psidii MF-1 TaxID=1389203 RepID=A0A9Q3DA83_9BASI|nr:hypothetical protein [Austropuccinia psidii MF-1]